jgi:hypothetical protein
MVKRITAEPADPPPPDINVYAQRGAEPIYVEQGPLLTLQQVADLTGRRLRLIQRWAENGTLPIRYHEPHWPYKKLVRPIDLLAIATIKRWEVKRGKAKTVTTKKGKAIRIRPVTHAEPWVNPNTEKEAKGPDTRDTF